MSHTDFTNDFDFGAYLTILRRRKWYVLLGVLLTLGLALVISFAQSKVYTASTTVLVPQDVQSAVNPSQPQAFTSADLLDRHLQDEILFAQGTAVKNAVRVELGRVPAMIITPAPQSDILSFQAQAPSAVLAARYADAYANAYLQRRRQSKAQDYLGTASILSHQINALRSRKSQLSRNDPSQAAIQSSIVNLQSSLSQLQASGQLSRAGGEVVNSASVPSSPSSPNIPRNGVIGAFLGLLIGLWLAFMADRIDSSIKSMRDLQAASGLPLLGVIPWVETWRRPKEGYLVSVERPTAPSAESYRTLRTAISMLTDSNDFRTIGFTSAKTGEGKTATVANLGAVLASAGKRVAIVDCDLRRPRLKTFFGLDGSVGITSMLLGSQSLDEASQAVDSVPGLTLLASGDLPPNPSEFLSVANVAGLIESLGRDGSFDLVLIDCPPVLPVPDALQIAGMVDGVVIVAGVGKVKKQEVTRTIELLSQVNAPLVGTILNGVGRTNSDDYGYDYSTVPPSSSDGTSKRARRVQSRLRLPASGRR